MMKKAASSWPFTSAVAAASLESARSVEFVAVTPLSRKRRKARGRIPLPSSPTWILRPRKSLRPFSAWFFRWKSHTGS
jgi:hypothetical protein